MANSAVLISLGLEIHCETNEAIHSIVENILQVEAARGMAFNFTAASVFVDAQKDKSILDSLKNGMTFCDSKPMLWYLQKTSKLPSNLVRSRGTGFMEYVWNCKNPSNFKHFLIAPNLESAQTLSNLFTENSKCGQIVGVKVPSFTSDLEDLLSQTYTAIKNSQANVIWIGIGSPKQILLADLLAKRIPGVMLTVGAAFDILSGGKREAPILIQNLGLEWLFRWIQEPKRLFKRYTTGNIQFIMFLFRDYRKLYKKMN
jgi:N-acetylglucosaminyldiphosphoundecaprenol N-acetyl-beta-D-mannosaminyltransferase